MRRFVADRSKRSLNTHGERNVERNRNGLL
jgi:hypothetical protein